MTGLHVAYTDQRLVNKNPKCTFLAKISTSYVALKGKETRTKINFM